MKRSLFFLFFFFNLSISCCVFPFISVFFFPSFCMEIEKLSLLLEVTTSYFSREQLFFFVFFSGERPRLDFIFSPLLVKNKLSWIGHLFFSFLESYTLGCSSFKGIKNTATQCVAVFFISQRTFVVLCEFYPLQARIFLQLEETTLIFFRVYNPLIYTLLNYTLYFIFPEIHIPSIQKIQCFCFDSLMLYAFDILDLPVLFYIFENVGKKPITLLVFFYCLFLLDK